MRRQFSSANARPILSRRTSAPDEDSEIAGSGGAPVISGRSAEPATVKYQRLSVGAFADPQHLPENDFVVAGRKDVSHRAVEPRDGVVEHRLARTVERPGQGGEPVEALGGEHATGFALVGGEHADREPAHGA